MRMIAAIMVKTEIAVLKRHCSLVGEVQVLVLKECLVKVEELAVKVLA